MAQDVILIVRPDTTHISTTPLLPASGDCDGVGAGSCEWAGVLEGTLEELTASTRTSTPLYTMLLSLVNTSVAVLDGTMMPPGKMDPDEERRICVSVCTRKKSQPPSVANC
jgi:hypothetical protein